VAAAVVLAALVFANVKRARGSATEVELASVERKELVSRVSGSGRIEARRSVSVTANVVGKVLEVAVEEGDVVKKGDLILRVDPGDRRAMREQAEAEVARVKAEEALANAELRKSQSDLRRVEGLVEQGLASAQELEARSTEHDVATARLQAAREQMRNAVAALDYARRELDKTEIRAEISGVVVRLAVEEGENVLAGDLYNPGSSIVDVADLSQMEAHVLVDETEVVQVKRGQRAEVSVDAFPDSALGGSVIEVGNSAYNPGVLGSQESKDFRVKVLLDSTRIVGLRPGLSVSAKIETARKDSALAVPIEALTIRTLSREDESWRRSAGSGGAHASTDTARTPGDAEDEEVEGVFVLRDGRARFVPVETGIAGEKDFEVVAGLSGGEEIVRGPFDAVRRLESGDKVKRAKTTPDEKDAKAGEDETR
jgi:HlyD family secretion protein